MPESFRLGEAGDHEETKDRRSKAMTHVDTVLSGVSSQYRQQNQAGWTSNQAVANIDKLAAQAIARLLKYRPSESDPANRDTAYASRWGTTVPAPDTKSVHLGDVLAGRAR